MCSFWREPVESSSSERTRKVQTNVMTRARRADVICWWCTSRQHGMHDHRPYRLHSSFNSLSDSMAGARGRQQTLMIRFAIFWWRRWRVFRTTRFTAQVDSYQPLLPLARLLGCRWNLHNSAAHLPPTDSRRSASRFSTVLQSDLSFHSLTFRFLFSRPRETASVLLFTTLGPLRVACRLWSHAV